MKAGEGNPQAREEEGKRQGLLGMERSSSLAGIPGIWGLEFYGKATTMGIGIQWESHCFHSGCISNIEYNIYLFQYILVYIG